MSRPENTKPENTRPENPRPYNPFPSVFLASNPDKLKEFNNQLSEILIKEMDEAYKILAAGRVEDYIAAVNDIIARNFDTEKKITAMDLLQDNDLAKNLEIGLSCNSTEIARSSFSTNQKAVPLLNVVFPEFNYTQKCDPAIPDYPLDTPFTTPEDTSYISNFNQAIANALFGSASKEDLQCALRNPPQVNMSWWKKAQQDSYFNPNLNQTFTRNYNYSCAIPPFIQNYILSSDKLSEAGGKEHFIFNSPSANASIPFLHYVGASLDSSENAAYVNEIGGNKMFFAENDAFNPKVILHEVLHWLGIKHAQNNPNLEKFLKEWGVKVGDPYPSISGYSSVILDNEKGFKNYIGDNDVMRSDTRQSYLRPFDVMILETLRHKRMVCLPQREDAGYVVDDTNITRSIGQECSTDYMSELEKHSFETLPSSSQRILAQSFKRVVGVEIPLTLAEIAIQSMFEASEPSNEREKARRDFILSENGIDTLRRCVRAVIK